MALNSGTGSVVFCPTENVSCSFPLAMNNISGWLPDKSNRKTEGVNKTTFAKSTQSGTQHI